jgi:hypothetical protein
MYVLDIVVVLVLSDFCLGRHDASVQDLVVILAFGKTTIRLVQQVIVSEAKKSRLELLEATRESEAALHPRNDVMALNKLRRCQGFEHTNDTNFRETIRKGLDCFNLPRGVLYESFWGRAISTNFFILL